MPKSYICFDFGTKRIGVALGNDLTETARELKPIKAKDGIPNWQEVESLINTWQPKALVVGLPLNMDGSESDMSLRAKKFANRLHGRFHLNVALQDERLSSFEAKGMVLNDSGAQNFGDYSVDGIAACLVLESWFASRKNNDV
jgi:putative pre-16S rRNA nuclease